MSDSKHTPAENHPLDIEPRRTVSELVEYATTHSSLEVRVAAADALYQRGRFDAAKELRASLVKVQP